MLSSAQMHWPSNEGRPGSPGSDDATPEAVSLQLERLWDMVKRQQQSITDLHIDNEALRQTLGRKMLLETTEYEIIRHRVRFTDAAGSPLRGNCNHEQSDGARHFCS